jgi:hypothetical protein
MKNVSDKRCRKNKNTHFMFVTFLKKSAVYEIKWENVLELGKP